MSTIANTVQGIERELSEAGLLPPLGSDSEWNYDELVPGLLKLARVTGKALDDGKVSLPEAFAIGRALLGLVERSRVTAHPTPPASDGPESEGPQTDHLGQVFDGTNWVMPPARKAS